MRRLSEDLVAHGGSSKRPNGSRSYRAGAGVVAVCDIHDDLHRDGLHFRTGRRNVLVSSDAPVRCPFGVCCRFGRRFAPAVANAYPTRAGGPSWIMA